MLGHDRNSTHGQALSQTAEAFVRGDAWKDNRPRKAVRPMVKTVEMSPGLGIDADAFAPGSGTVWRVDRSLAVALRHQRSFAITRQLRGYGSLTAGFGHTLYDLPNGMGVATEPVTIDMRSAFLQPEIGVQQSWSLPHAQLQTSVGLGTQGSVTTTSVQSNFFNVVYRSAQIQPYAAVRLGVRPDFLPLAAEIEARVARDGLTQIRADLHLPL